MVSIDEFVADCRGRGIKVTPQRVAVFACVREHRGHPSAEEVHQHVRQAHPGLSLATVYNTLQLLVELGQVREAVVDDTCRRYDPNVEPHQHAVCRRCRRIFDVRVPEAEALDHAAVCDDFVVESVSVEFTGVCGPCARSG